MKVLQINTVCGIGSTGRIAVDLYLELVKQGHDGLIAYGRGSVQKNVQSCRIGSDFDMRVHGAVTRLTDRHGFASKRGTERFVDIAEQFNPDVIHLHNIHGYYLHLPTLFHYLKRAAKPVIWTLHDCWAITGHCSHFDYIGCDKWKKQCFKCPQKKEYPASLLLDSARGNYNDKKELFTSIADMTIVTPSKWLEALVRESYLKKYPVKVINNGIDLNSFKPADGNFRAKNAIEGNKILLGVSSVWNEKKGFNTFLNMAQQLKNDEKIVLVGLTHKQLKLCPKNIIGIERTNSIAELAEIYTASDVFVNPTLEDTFPTTNMEAIACGTPVVCYNTGGAPETILKNAGAIVEKNNFDALLKTAREVILNPAAFSINKDDLKRYDRQISTRQYIELYNKEVKA